MEGTVRVWLINAKGLLRISAVYANVIEWAAIYSVLNWKQVDT